MGIDDTTTEPIKFYSFGFNCLWNLTGRDWKYFDICIAFAYVNRNIFVLDCIHEVLQAHQLWSQTQKLNPKQNQKSGNMCSPYLYKFWIIPNFYWLKSFYFVWTYTFFRYYKKNFISYSENKLHTHQLKSNSNQAIVLSWTVFFSTENDVNFGIGFQAKTLDFPLLCLES